MNETIRAGAMVSSLTWLYHDLISLINLSHCMGGEAVSSLVDEKGCSTTIIW